MRIDRATFLALTVSIAAAAVACTHAHPADEHGSSGGVHSSKYPSCDAIIKACHQKDVGAGPVNDCHSQAHEATGDAVCATRKDACLKTCQEAVVDGGSTDAGDGGG